MFSCHFLESINQSRTNFVDDWSIRQNFEIEKKKFSERNADKENKLYQQIRLLELDENNLKVLRKIYEKTFYFVACL